MSSLSPPLKTTRPEADPLLVWRRHTTALLLRLFVVMIIPLMLINTANQIRLERWPFALYHLASTLLVLGLAFARPHNHNLRGMAIVTYYLGTSLATFLVFGHFSIAPGLLFIAVVFAVILLGPRAGRAVIALGVTGLIMILGGFGQGLIPYPYEPVSHATEWPVIFNHMAIITGLATMLAITVSSLVTALQTSFQATQAALAELERVNSSLEATVQARTDELRRSQALLQGLLDHAPVAIFVKNPEGRYLLTNRYMHQVHKLGWMEGSQDTELFGADAETWRAHERAMLVSQEPVAAEVITPHYDGPHLYYEIKFPLGDAIGGIAVDITARKEVELALAAQLRYAEALARCSRILLTPVKTSTAFQNSLAAALDVVRIAVKGDRIAISRYTPHEEGEAHILRSYQLLAVSARPGLPPQRPPTPEELEDLPPPLNVWQREGGTFNGPVSGRFPAHPLYQRYNDECGVQSVFIQSLDMVGRWWGHISVTDHGQARSWDSGAVQLIQTAADFIVTFTEGWEAAQALRAREAQLRAVGDNLPNGFIYQYRYDPDRRPSFTFLSSGVQQVFGVTPDAVLADPEALQRYVAPEERERLAAAELRSLEEMSVFAELVRHVLADDSERWLYLCSRPRHVDNGSVVWDGVALDITERQQAAEELLIDWATLTHLMESLDQSDSASVVMVTQLFANALPPQLDALEAAVAAGDAARAKREAHRLRGGSLQLGALAMAALCRQIERSFEPDELRALAERLRACYTQTHALLRQRYPTP